MEDTLGKEEIQSFAGHLLAELFRATDEFNHGRMTRDEYERRVRIINRRRRSGENGLLRSMENIQLNFSNSLRRGTEMMR